MEADFWHQRWAENNIGFHVADVNPMLSRFWDRLELREGARIFLPLCGKTRDIAWLLSKGYKVCAVELSQLAIDQLFEELGVVPQVSDVQGLKKYSYDNLDIFVGDFFALTSAVLGPVDAVYDRAALVALPIDMRKRYSVHLRRLSENAAQLLVCYVYDQNVVDGPPFSISDEEVNMHYALSHRLDQLIAEQVPQGMRGKTPAWEHVWLLTPLS